MSIEKLILTLENCDISIESCMHDKCTEWVVMTYDICSGIQCDKCKKYVCEKHGESVENRNTFPSHIFNTCNNCIEGNAACLN